ncbi:stomatin (EPB72)-like 3b isoform X1 [Osmerus mordax]|uniref:stomatin (EPB72)-like 3b isoform X1 n=1 Tax=Osmerus mordax TaxID=8014 RepID=UPI00350ED9C6
MEMENNMESQKRQVISTDDLIADRTGSQGCCGWFLVILSGLFVLLTFPVSIFMCVKIVQEYERAVIFRLGRITDRKAKGPGIFFVLPCTDSFIKVDLRTISFDIPPQEILTKDSVTVSVDGVVYFRVNDPISSVANVSNADYSTRLLAQTTLRNVLGTKNLAEVLSDREGISHSMQSTLDVATDVWGIKVERVEIKDVKLPHQLQRAMAAEAEASREARAKVPAQTGQRARKRARSFALDADVEAFVFPHAACADLKTCQDACECALARKISTRASCSAEPSFCQSCSS